MPALKRAPSCDIFEAMVAWVEEDAEPGSLTAVKYTDNDVDQGVAFERPLCVVSRECIWIVGVAVCLTARLAFAYTVPKDASLQGGRQEQGELV